jgi:excisionase family DNA binding protein
MGEYRGIKFYSGRRVIDYWFLYGYAVKNYAIPGVFITDDDEAQVPSITPEQCDYPDWWYTWVDIDKIIGKLSHTEHLLIIYYCTKVFSPEKYVGDLNLEQWNKRGEFKNLCNKVYRLLDDEEYKPIREYHYKNFSQTLSTIHSRIERGVIDVTSILKDEFYTVPEVAKMLKYKEDTIRRILRSGELQGFKLSGEWRIAGSTLLKLIGGEDEQK